MESLMLLSILNTEEYRAERRAPSQAPDEAWAMAVTERMESGVW
jgi:hypothetical protein